MCDIPLLTGIGILLSGYISLSCFISAYHWQLVVYLAWFSHLTHIACLTALRRYFHYHPLKRNLRLFFMTMLWSGLILAMVPTVFFNWITIGERTASLPSSSASCFFDLTIGRALFNNSGCYWIPINVSHIVDSYHRSSSCKSTHLVETTAMQSATISILLLGFIYFSRIIMLTKRLSDGVRMTVRQETSNRYIKAWPKV